MFVVRRICLQAERQLRFVISPWNGCVSLHDVGPAPQQCADTCTLQDYHRFHLPVSGTIRCIRHVRGKLYTVNPIAVAGTYANVFTQVLKPLHHVSD